MKVRRIMTRQVLALKPSESLHTAIQKFAKKGVSGAPVIDSSNKIVGVVSDADITKALDVAAPNIRVTSSKLFGLAFASLRSKKEETQLREELKEARKIKVSSFMCDPVVINQDASLMDAVKVMVNNNVNRLPVVNGHKKIVGIIARADIIKALSINFSK